MKYHRTLKRRPGSYLPSKRKPWEACKAKLREAETAIGTMVAAEDRVSFEDAWSNLVDSLEEAWTSFYDEGNDISSRFQPWAGSKDRERRKDQLLRYLIESRHKNQHGRLKLDWAETKALIAPGFNGLIHDLKGQSDGTFEFGASPSAEGEEDKLQVVLEGGEPILPVIENRGEIYSPPDGMPPLTAARTGLSFYEALINEAAEKFST